MPFSHPVAMIAISIRRRASLPMKNHKGTKTVPITNSKNSASTEVFSSPGVFYSCDEIAQTVHSAEQIADEIQRLFAALGGR